MGEGHYFLNSKLGRATIFETVNRGRATISEPKFFFNFVAFPPPLPLLNNDRSLKPGNSLVQPIREVTVQPSTLKKKKLKSGKSAENVPVKRAKDCKIYYIFLIYEMRYV